MAVATTTIHNLGPLTTVWTAPSTCNYNYFLTKTLEGWQAQECLSQAGNFGPVDNLGCWPPISGPLTAYSQTPIGSLGFYSPGIVCPAGMTKACEQTGGSGYRNFFFDYPPAESETAYGCCPSGFVCSVNGLQSCLFVATTAIPTVQCIDGSISSGEMAVPGVTYASSGTRSPSMVTYSEVNINARMIQIVFKDSDIPTPTGSAATPGQTSDTPSDETAGSALRSGAIAGIVVGVVAGIALLGFAGFCFYRARSRKPAPLLPPEIELDGEQKKDLDTMHPGPINSQQASHPGMHWQGQHAQQVALMHHELQ